MKIVRVRKGNETYHARLEGDRLARLRGDLFGE
ncbi:MAG TPA: hypothetical protein DD727_02570, partial [Clostridiales bacterium]|nr:hypothetical protein [Clostridiales bacterium]